MVRTKADRNSAKAVGGKAPHKTSSAKSSGGAKKVTISKGKNYSGGNPYHPRDTPDWQKPITCFMNQSSNGEKMSTSDVEPPTKEKLDQKNDEFGNETD